jgi:predicted RNA-binding Zn ribbon-like protein
MPTKLQGPAPVTELWFAATQPEDLFAPIAHRAAMLFANLDHHRVRKRGQCVLHFYDSSKKGTRRWCSMQLCGNRRKVAAYALASVLGVPADAWRRTGDKLLVYVLREGLSQPNGLEP